MISQRILAAVFIPALCLAQTPAPAAAKPEVPPNPPPSTVYVNPRSGPDDPRIGLKGGLYDAGEAIFGLERMTSLPKPTGFAPGDSVVVPAALPTLPPAPGEPAPPPPGPPGQYGSTNSDLAFSGNHLFVGNYNGINTTTSTIPAKSNCRMSTHVPRRPGRCLGLWPSALHVGRSHERTHRLRHPGRPASRRLCKPPPAPAAAHRSRRAARTPASSACRRPARTVSAASASSTSATSPIRSRWPPCRAAAVPTLTPW